MSHLPTAPFPGLRALLFDVFGTVVDWRSSVAREVEELATRIGRPIDGPAFADAWRAQYAPSMHRVRTGELPWLTLDQLHRRSLDAILPQFGLDPLTEEERAHLTRAWGRLQPWPDAVSGLSRLKRAFVIAPLSNGNLSLMIALARYAQLPWDCVLGAELARHYKPDPAVYQCALDLLDPAPGVRFGRYPRADGARGRRLGQRLQRPR
ncbi:MAG: HAD-IA family hydrolase [Gemmatimonadales bacterium]